MSAFYGDESTATINAEDPAFQAAVKAEALRLRVEEQAEAQRQAEAKARVDEQMINAEMEAAKDVDELRAVLAKHNMLAGQDD